LAAERIRRDDERQGRDRLREALSQQRQESVCLWSRIEVLQGMLRSHEGLSVGVREVFRFLEEPGDGPWKTVLGMIGDFLTVKRDYAALIDLALGDWAQRFVVRDLEELRAALAAKGEPLAGRVSFLPLARAVGNAALDDLKANRLVQLSLLSRVREADGAAIAPEHP